MASYTIEDIELIRRKSGISYQEAVALLDYHNGNVARALVDLERNGRLKSETEQKQDTSNHIHIDQNTVSRWFTKLFQCRIKVRKDSVTIVNLSILFILLSLLISPHLVLISILLMLILGYKVTFTRRDHDFASINLQKMVRNAAQNVKDSVASMAKEFDSANKAENESVHNEKHTTSRSYYHTGGCNASPAEPAPTIQVPVQVESQEGKVTVEKDSEGYTSATIE